MYFSSVHPHYGAVPVVKNKVLRNNSNMLHYADLDYKDRLLQLSMLPLPMRREYEDCVLLEVSKWHV